MRVMSLDQSTSKTGWSCWENLNLEEYGLIDCTHKKQTTDERFEEMCLAIQKLIEEQNPEIVLIEDTTMQRNPQALKLLSRLQGFIICVCLNNYILYEVLHPSTWRSWLGFKKGKRDELKLQAMEFVQRELFINDATEDESESLCIAFAYCKEILQLKET